MAGCALPNLLHLLSESDSGRQAVVFLYFMEASRGISPELVTMENVSRLKDQDVFKEFIGTLRDAEYHIDNEIVNCEDYGIPQHRQRLVLLASKLGPVHLLSSSQFGAKRTTVRESIADLPPLQAGEVDRSDPLHQASALSELNRKRLEASKPGGTWRDWQMTLVADCHKKKTGKSYSSVYGRMSWEEPAPTVTTQFFGFGNGRFGHPQQDRAISLREGAILQSFPKSYEFVPSGQPIYKKSVGRLIGNAVPPETWRSHWPEYNLPCRVVDENSKKNRHWC